MVDGGFQSTPPSREATGGAMIWLTGSVVSIHAPLTGGDRPVARPRRDGNSFNPRPPHGRRLPIIPHSEIPPTFQSTPPSREATVDHIPFDTYHPAFQSTPPSREATRSRRGISTTDMVSIHAPLTGGDMQAPPATSWGVEFQSTPPSREATRTYVALRSQFVVSIHAPLTGGDITTITYHNIIMVSIHAPLTGGDHGGLPIS